MGRNRTTKWTALLVAVIFVLMCLSVPVCAKTAAKASPKKQTTEKTDEKEIPSKKDTSKKKSPAKKASTTKESSKKDSVKKETSKKDSKKKEKPKKEAKKKKQASKKTSPKAKGKKPEAESTEDTAESQAQELKEESKDTLKIQIRSDDPKAFTKALLYEKEGIDFEVVDPQKPKKKSKKNARAEQDTAFFNSVQYFDFSDMLIPVTHEALLGSPYGVRDHRLHRGVDVNVVMKEPIVAAYPGKVIMSKYNKGGYGHYVLLEHENGLQTLYGHLAERSVKVGDYVYPGDIVGLAGNTGRSSGAHLHFEIRYGEVNIDPATIINFPKWELKPRVDKLPKKKVIEAHRKMQAKLKKENFYIVKKGDTLTDVALWFNISEDAVIRINNLHKGQPLKIGQTLKGCK